MKIHGHYSVETLWFEHYPDRHSIHKHLVRVHFRILWTQGVEGFVLEHYAISLGAAFGHHCQSLAGPTRGRLEGEVHGMLDSHSCEDANIVRDCECRVIMRRPSLTGVLSFVVLTDDHPIQAASIGAIYGRRETGKDANRMDIHILIQQASWLDVLPTTSISVYSSP